MRIMEMVLIAVAVLAVFGPKTLQSFAKGAGKSVAQAKQMKEKVLSDIGVDELKKMTEGLPQVPLNSMQAVDMLVSPPKQKKTQPAIEKQGTVESVPVEPSKPAAQVVAPPPPAETHLETRTEGK